MHFDGYNNRFGSDGSRERLEWDNLKEEIEEFKREHIYQTIIDTEVNDMSYPLILNLFCVLFSLTLHAVLYT